METTAFIDIRFEKIFGTSTIQFRNMRLLPYITSTSLMSLIVTGVALLALSSGEVSNITGKDITWASLTWAIGAFLHLPILLFFRSWRGPVCQYCQKPWPDEFNFCRECDEKYDLSGARKAAEEHIMNHIRGREEAQSSQVQP